MGSKFKPGDVVRRKFGAGPPSLMDRDLVVESVDPMCNDGINDVKLVGVAQRYGSRYFTLVREADPVITFPGVPEGYTAVAYRSPEIGESIVGVTDGEPLVIRYANHKNQLIIKPIVPPEPEMREVEVFEWVVVYPSGSIQFVWDVLELASTEYLTVTKTGNVRKVKVPVKK